jgi:hypothetical protein
MINGLDIVGDAEYYWNLIIITVAVAAHLDCDIIQAIIIGG